MQLSIAAQCFMMSIRDAVLYEPLSITETAGVSIATSLISPI